MAVDAPLTGDLLIAAVLSLREIGQMVNEMLEENRDHPPQFKRFKAQQNPRRMLPQASERLGGALWELSAALLQTPGWQSRPLERH